MLKIKVTTAEAVIQETEIITAGRRGLVCGFEFDSAWDGLVKTVVVVGVVKRDINLLGDSITVPGECLTKENFPVRIGVYGATGDGTIAIPTVWANFGRILPSAQRSDIPPDELTPDLVSQIQQNANNALYLAQSVSNQAASGAFNGVSPTVLVASITGGHQVSITDVNGTQQFDVMDGKDGSGGSSDYSDLTNKPKINGVTLEGNKTLAQIGAGTYSVPSGGIPKTDLASDVQTSLGKADTALQQHQSLSDYRTASAQDLIDQEQDAAIAGKLPATGNAYRAVSIPMGHLDAASTATVMTATVTGITELRDGVCVWLTNGVIASASGVTLNVNGLGAKPIYNSLTGALVTTTFTAASTYLFVYNSTRITGGCWDMVYGYDTNTTYTPVKLGFGYTTCSIAEATAAKTAALSSYTLTANGIVSVKFTNAVGAGATLNINSKGAKAIHYRGAAITDGIIKAGDTATFIYSTYYHLIAIDRANPTKTSELTNDSGFLTQHQDISGKLDKSQGVAHAGEFCVVGSDGNITTVAMSAWQGGNY